MARRCYRIGAQPHPPNGLFSLTDLFANDKYPERVVCITPRSERIRNLGLTKGGEVRRGDCVAGGSAFVCREFDGEAANRIRPLDEGLPRK